VAEKAARIDHAWSNAELCLRAPLTNHGFTISGFIAVAIAMIAEHVWGSSSEHKP
jgi:hypothetical protein